LELIDFASTVIVAQLIQINAKHQIAKRTSGGTSPDWAAPPWHPTIFNSVNGLRLIVESRMNKLNIDTVDADRLKRCLRLLTREEAAAYCRLSPQGFSRWVKMGLMPGSIAGTARWDLKAIDAALDAASGIGSNKEEDAFDKWKRERNARTSSRGG
jgi:hypothetical protein